MMPTVYTDPLTLTHLRQFICGKMYLKVKEQCLLMVILIMLMFTSSFLFTRNNQMDVYYVKAAVRATEASSPVTQMKRVTKSLTELGKMDEINKFVLLLNQIPNCGAEVLTFLLQKMQGPNNYRHVRLKGGWRRRNLNSVEQELFVDEVYKIMRNEAVPLSFDRQIYFINFTLFDRQSPTYINLIREPLDKVLSRSLYHNTQDHTDDLIQCLIQGNGNCTDKRINVDQLTVPYFCGHDSNCLLNDQWALQRAKSNAEKYYPVIGVLEEMNATLEVLEHEIPYFFKGVQDIYKTNLIDKFLRKRVPQSKPKMRKRLERILAKEYEFYNWVKGRLFKQLQMLSGDNDAH